MRFGLVLRDKAKGGSAGNGKSRMGKSVTFFFGGGLITPRVKMELLYLSLHR